MIIFTEEHKRNMSENHADISGKKNPCYGKNHSGKNNPNYKKRVLFICKYCGEIKFVIPQFANNRKYCSQECYFLSGHSKETIEKMRIASSGEKNGRYIDGRTKINSPYPDDWTDTLREAIRQRDDYTCQECGTHQDELKGRIRKLDIHHIDYNKDNCNPDNLITLCKKCHTKTNSNRDYWIDYFTNLIH